jgi:hypothetical protein
MRELPLVEHVPDSLLFDIGSFLTASLKGEVPTPNPRIFWIAKRLII